MLRNEIRENWKQDHVDNLQIIESLNNDYPAYTIKTCDGYGVAIPISNDIQVNEDFSNARLITQTFFVQQKGISESFLTLIAPNTTDEKIFSSLCEQFVFPGAYGEFRNEIVSSPLKWWIDMKQLLGNKDSDEMIYDTLGELVIYDYLVRRDIAAKWAGPKGSSIDIETNDEMIEVKSSIVRSRKEVTIHGKSQLISPHNKKLFLCFCVFEMSSNTGISINDIVYNLANDGYDVTELNKLLEGKGFGLGKSSRDRKFILWNVYKYTVDDSFPRIIDSSFVGGTIPEGISNIAYTVNLDGLPCNIIIDNESQKAEQI